MTRARYSKENRAYRKANRRRRKGINVFLRERLCIYCSRPLESKRTLPYCINCVSYLDGNPAATIMAKLRDNPLAIS